jgi:hypothetical protein
MCSQCLKAFRKWHRVGQLVSVGTIIIYAPMIYSAFDAGSIHYWDKWEGVGPWKSRVFRAL